MIGRVGRICAVAFVPIAVISAMALPGNTTGIDWGTLFVFLIIFAVLVAVPLWVVATGVSSPNRSTRRICGWSALAGVVLPVFAMVGDWSGNNWSGRLGDAIIWTPIVAICAAMFVVTLVADRRSSVVPGTHRV